jgi:hypothetical protein
MCCVEYTNVSEEHAASIIYTDDGGSSVSYGVCGLLSNISADVSDHS